MHKIVKFCLAGVAALTLASCACPVCGGIGTEVAMTPGVHPYTGVKYKANEVISCRRCGGSGQSHSSAAAAGMSVTAPGAREALTAPLKVKTQPTNIQINTYRSYSRHYY